MRWTWDRANIRHQATHGVSPTEAEQCYRNDPLVVEEQFTKGEERWLALGESDEGRRLALVFTYRESKVGVITAFPMSREQRALYEEG